MPKLATREVCTGCTACASSCPKDCITMKADESGFLFPAVDGESCISCGLCEKNCPVITPLILPENEPEAYAAYTKDEAVRLRSSSGGIFTELARDVLESDGAVYGAAYNDRFEVIHTCVESEKELGKLCGAKYAQSDLRGIFREVRNKLNKGQSVLFAGTPCQVGGLKAYLPKDYENLLTVDFVCHSVPSPMAWQAYVQYRSQQDNGGEPPVSVNLRSKITGWSRYQYANLFQYPDGNSHTAKSADSLYMKLFVGGYINRESCTNCQFKGYHRISDVTLGDFWGIWDIDPEMDDNKGTSVVLAHSDRGVQLLQRICDRVMLKSVTLEEAARQNSAMLLQSKPNVRREEALTSIRNGEIGVCEQWFLPEKPTLRNRVRGILGRIVRKLR